MTDWTTTFLGIIAASVVIMALIQVVLIVSAVLTARKVNAMAHRIEREIGPVAMHVNAIVHQVQEGVAIATERLHRFEDSLVRIAERVNTTVGTVQSGVMKPAREGAALAAGARAVVRALRRPPTGGVQ